MLNCKQTVEIVSSKDRFTWRQKLELRLHLLICHHCRKYVEHLKIMKNGFKNLIASKSQKVDKNKIQDLEARIIQKLKDDLK